MGIIIFIYVIIFCFLFSTLYVFFKKNLHIWIASYVFRSWGKKGNLSKTFRENKIHIFLCLVDHFEPKWEKPSKEIENKRVDIWCEEYPKLARKHRDSEGRYPQHTFFYPEEEYEEEHLNKLSRLCKAGFGDIEIHLHHENDTAENFANKLIIFKKILYERHGLLRKEPNNGKIIYGFIHGNWALNNSRRDGRHCGVNHELEILKNTGCYADFTLPSAPSDTQTRKINSIYYAADIPGKPKSHNTGIDVAVGKETTGDLMIIQGPLALNWKWRKYGILPRIENSDISYSNPPTRDRVDLWVRQNISVKGAPDKIFIKIHTHGAQEGNFPILLGNPLDRMFYYLEEKYNDQENFVLHYVTTWEMFNIIKELERIEDN